jgi:aryl-alcohol dehydrogenase-like predicted oxidoreductase
MRFRSLGTTGLKVSELGLGCSSLGASVFHADEAESVRVLETAFDSGINYFDTAGSYAYGRSEALLGRVFCQRRDKVIIATKTGFLPSSLARFGRVLVPVLGGARRLITPYKRTLKGLSKKRQDFSSRHVITSLERSLRRLRSEYVDLFQLHNPPESVLERDDLFETLEKLRQQGKIRHFGISAGTTDEAILSLKRKGVSALQVEFNLLHREAATKLFHEANHRNIGLIARIPFARGVLTSDGQVTTGLQTILTEDLQKARARVRDVQDALRGRPFLPEAALRFVLGYPQVSAVIAGTTSERHLRENVRVLEDPQLSAEDMQLVADAFFDLRLRV